MGYRNGLKAQKVMDENWDYLIILDACRYDFFERVYDEYLEGELEKRRSKGSHTVEWLAETFREPMEDVTYISANPHINGYGVSLKDMGGRYDWNPTNCFSEVIDVWESGWNEELGTVHPREVNKAFLSNRDGKRKIIHYNQPHTPYLSRAEGKKKGRAKRKEELYYIHNRRGEKNMISKVIEQIRNRLGKRIREVFGWRFAWEIRRILNLEPQHFERLFREEGYEQLLNYYEENLRTVLGYVSNLVDEIDGNVVVTSDHGEAFGERNVWGHEEGKHIPVLVEVPWLEVEI